MIRYSFIKTIFWGIGAFFASNLLWFIIDIVKHNATSNLVVSLHVKFMQSLVHSCDVFIVLGAWCAYESYKYISLRYKMKKSRVCS